jgi:uncharacterized RDD family membrane protein YckC
MLKWKSACMNWYYAKDGQQVGPVGESEWTQLLSLGTITPSTLVWREGMANWQPFSEVQSERHTAIPPVPAAAQAGLDVICIECGKSFPADEVIRYGDSSVCANCKPVFVQKLQEGARLLGTMDYAGFWIRFAAKLLDGLILLVPILILTVIFLVPALQRPGRGQAPFMSVGLQLGLQLAYYALAGVYNIFFLGRYGATPGKMALKIRVVTADGDKISYGRATGRFFGEILSGLVCNIGYIIAAFDDEKRALHDRICNTRVVKS